MILECIECKAKYFIGSFTISLVDYNGGKCPNCGYTDFILEVSERK